MSKQALARLVALAILLCHMSIARADLRADLTQAFNKYQTAFLARNGAALKASVSARYGMELRNKAISEKLKFPPQIAEDMVPQKMDLTKFKFVKAMQKGPTACLLYCNEEHGENLLWILPFVQENGSWKFIGDHVLRLSAATAHQLVAGQGLKFLQDEGLVPPGKVSPVPPALPMPAYVGRLSFLTHGFDQLTVICNGVVTMADAFPPVKTPDEAIGGSEVVLGGLRQGVNIIVIKAVPSQLPTVQPSLSLDIQAKSDKGKKATVFDFDTKKGFTEERQTFEVTDDIIRTGTDRYADAGPPITPDGGRILSGLKGRITSLSFSPDGKWLAASSILPSGIGTFYEGGIGVWNTKTYTLDHVPSDTMETDEAQVLFSPNSKILVSTNHQWKNGGAKTSAQLWDTQTWQSLVTLPDVKTAETMAISPDSRLLLTNGYGENQAASVWSMATGKPAGKPLAQEGVQVGAVFTSDGKTLITLSWVLRPATATVPKHSESVLRFWDTATWKVSRTQSFFERISNLTYSVPRQVLVAVQWGKKGTDSSDDGSLIVWDAKTGKTLRIVPLHNDVTALAFSADGRRLAVAHNKVVAKLSGGGELLDGGEVTLYTMPHFEAAKTVASNKDIISALAFAPDGKTLATSGQDATVRLWNIDSPVVAKAVHPQGHGGSWPPH